MLAGVLSSPRRRETRLCLGRRRRVHSSCSKAVQDGRGAGDETWLHSNDTERRDAQPRDSIQMIFFDRWLAGQDEPFVSIPQMSQTKEEEQVRPPPPPAGAAREKLGRLVRRSDDGVDASLLLVSWRAGTTCCFGLFFLMGAASLASARSRSHSQAQSGKDVREGGPR